MFSLVLQTQAHTFGMQTDIQFFSMKATLNNIARWTGLLFFLALTIVGYFKNNILVSTIGGIFLGFSIKDLSSFFVLRERTKKVI